MSPRLLYGRKARNYENNLKNRKIDTEILAKNKEDKEENGSEV